MKKIILSLAMLATITKVSTAYDCFDNIGRFTKEQLPIIEQKYGRDSAMVKSTTFALAYLAGRCETYINAFYLYMENDDKAYNPDYVLDKDGLRIMTYSYFLQYFEKERNEIAPIVK